MLFLAAVSSYATDFTPTEKTTTYENNGVKTTTTFSRFAAPTNPSQTANTQNKFLQSNSNTLQTQDIKQIGSAISFAKSALIENTELAKVEFGMSDSQKTNLAKSQIQPQEITIDDTVKFDPSYNIPQYRDAFYTPQDSALVNQAVDYHSKGRKMIVKPRRFTMQKSQVTTNPIIHVSSVMYNDPSYWIVFTNIGKFTYAKSSINGIKISESSNNEIEFIIPLNATLQAESKKLGTIKQRNVSVQSSFVAVTLRTGECFFAKELEITKKCGARIEEIEKQVEI